MPMTVADPLFDPGVVEEPHPYFAHLRERDPVHYLEGADTFLVSRLALIQQVIADTTTYSSRSNEFLSVGTDGMASLRCVLDGDVGTDLPGILATADPPDHTRQRRVLGRVLSAGSIARREPDVRALVDDALRHHIERGHVEWMADELRAQRAIREQTTRRRCSRRSATRRSSRSEASRPRRRQPSCGRR